MFASDTTINLMLVPVTGSVALSGRVLDGLSTGLPGQTVNVQGSNSSATTDATGHYSVQVNPGSHSLLITGDNPSLTLNIPQMYNVTTATFNIAQDMTLDLALPLKQVNVHVQDANGAPVPNTMISTSCAPGLRVSLGAIGTSQTSCLYAPGAPTNGIGDATLWLFPTTGPATAYTLTATPPSGSIYIATTKSAVEITTDATVTITLVRPFIISGHVLDGLGNGLPGQTVKVQNTTTSGSCHK